MIPDKQGLEEGAIVLIWGVKNWFPRLHNFLKSSVLRTVFPVFCLFLNWFSCRWEEYCPIYLIHGCLFSALTTLVVATFLHGTRLRRRFCVQFVLVGESHSSKESENQTENGVKTCCGQTEFEIRPERARLWTKISGEFVGLDLDLDLELDLDF